jgi:hypothetical protein
MSRTLGCLLAPDWQQYKQAIFCGSKYYGDRRLQWDSCQGFTLPMCPRGSWFCRAIRRISAKSRQSAKAVIGSQRSLTYAYISMSVAASPALLPSLPW